MRQYERTLLAGIGSKRAAWAGAIAAEYHFIALIMEMFRKNESFFRKMTYFTPEMIHFTPGNDSFYSGEMIRLLQKSNPSFPE